MGERIACRIDVLDPPMTRKAFAEAIGLTPDADMHELVTG